MLWKAFTDRDFAGSGTVISIDRGYRDIPPQPGEEILIENSSSGGTLTVTVVSSSGDRLEVSDGKTLTSLTLSSGTRPSTLDESGNYFESWVVV